MKHKLLISIDGIRKDRLACYNRKVAWLTPNISRIASECVLFDDMMAAATSTAQCFTSILAGRNSVDFGRKVYTDNQNPFSDNIFSDHEEMGYKTVVSVNRRIESWINLINTFSKAEFWWTGKTIEESEKNTKDDASLRPKEQVQNFIKLSRQESKPLMAWMHLVGFSSPDKRFTGEVSQFEYDARVAELDEAIGIFFDYFRDNSEIFIFSDHGYAFFEQGRWAYGKDGHSLVEPVVNVPFLVYNGRHRGVNENLVSQIRVREIVKNSDRALDISNETAFCETRYEQQPDIALAIRKNQYKLNYYYSNQMAQFYDLKSDPLENIDYANGKFHKVTRREDGTHPDLKPYILRTDWENLSAMEAELLKLAKEYYGEELIERHKRNREGLNRFKLVRDAKSFIGLLIGRDR